jgi:hypothetical protein
VADEPGSQMADSSRRDAFAELPRRYDRPLSWWSKLRLVWNETGKSLQRVWITLWAVGLVLLGLGVWGDSSNFWNGRSYLVNLFSALTSAAFGIPLAFVILQRVTATQANAAEARAAVRMAAAVSSRLARAAQVLVKDEALPEGSILKLRAAKVYLENQRNTVPHEKNSYESMDRVHGSDLQLQSYVDALENTLTCVSELWNPTMVLLCAEVAAQWSILSTVSRPRLLETGGKWLPGWQEKELNRLVEIAAGSTLEFWQQESLSLLNDFHELLQTKSHDDMVDYIDIRFAVEQFNNQFEHILHYIDAVENLIGQSAVMERRFSKSPQ